MAGTHSIEHRGLVAGVAVAALGVAGLVAWQDPLPQWELDLTTRINGAPDPVAAVLYPLMQLGTLGAPIVAAGGILIVARDRVLAAATLITGVVTWFAAKGIKAVFERGRPLQYIPDIEVREGSGSGLGFVSGHAAVAAATAVMVIAAVPRRWRPLPIALAGLVGLGRIVHGVHLPADVVGGWAFGTLLALGALEIVDRVRV
jgi:undecaprenyl-diphosphatase